MNHEAFVFIKILAPVINQEALALAKDPAQSQIMMHVSSSKGLAPKGMR